MPITFRKLAVFVAAAEDGNFRRTADRLGISQPSVSAQIRSIEEQLGCELFQRRRGCSSTLSIEGRKLLAHAREVVKAERDLAAERELAQRSRESLLRVSVGPILLETRVKPALAEFYERHAHVALEFVPFNPGGEGEKAVRSGALDVLLYTGGPPERTDVRTEVVARVTCSLYGSAQLAREFADPDTDLTSAPFVMPPRHYHIARWLETQLPRNGIRCSNVVARAPYMEVARQMAADGKGLTILFDEHAADLVKNGQLQALRSNALTALRLMVLGRRALRPEMAPALRFLRNVARGTDSVAAVREPQMRRAATQ